MSLYKSELCFSKVSLLSIILYTRGTDVPPCCIITLSFLPLEESGESGFNLCLKLYVMSVSKYNLITKEDISSAGLRSVVAGWFIEVSFTGYHPILEEVYGHIQRKVNGYNKK